MAFGKTSREGGGWMSLDEYLVGNRDATYFLKMKTDSMAEEGIMKGDLVIVERGRTPKVGDIVAALSDGEYKLMHFKRGMKEVIEAVVTGVVRKYK